MATHMQESGREVETSHKKASYLMFAAGIVAILLPFLAGISVAILLGLTMILAGTAYVVLAFVTKESGLFFIRLVIGSIFVLSGIDFLLNPSWGLVTLTLFITILFSFEGATEILAFVRLRSWPRSGWLLANGLISLALAWMIWGSWPSSSVWAIGSLVGVNLMMSALTPLRFFHRHRPI